MASTSAVYARIDTGLKERAKSVLSQLGISPSSAIQMLYSQVVLTGGLPFTPRLPTDVPIAMRQLSKQELDDEIASSIRSHATGKAIPAEQAEELLAQEFGA